ncbi:hypothetical protein [Saliphagus sp. LR7]|uniref:hypothetical protein n=1 Tax=Saliphagus sp. LR7 TaxID=2282654 RepID=UPI0013003E7A|nr:hypothetical protein [Saliphagus sp. LR7]
MTTYDDSDQRYGAPRRAQPLDGNDSPVCEPVSQIPGAHLSNPFRQLPRAIASAAPDLWKRAKQRYRSINRTTVRTIATAIGRAIYPGSSRPSGRGGVEPTEYADYHGISSATTMHGFIARAKEATDDDAQFSNTSDKADSRDDDHHEVTPQEFARVFPGLPGGGVIFEDVDESSGAWIRADQVEDLEGWC